MTYLLLHSLFATQLLSASPEETRLIEANTKDDVAAATIPDETRLLEAVGRYDVETVRAMLKKDPSLAQRTKSPGRRSTLLVVAAFINYDGEYFWPPGKNEVLKEVLRYLPPTDAWEACIVGDFAKAKTFLDKDSDAIRSEKSGWSTLHAAAYSGNVELVKLLISRGANIEAIAKTKYKNTPLHTAMLTRQYEVARALVLAGADINHADGNYTALHDAARQGNAEIARFFIEHGADPNARTDRGETPVSAARSHGHPELAAELEKLAAKSTKSVGVARASRQAEDVNSPSFGVAGSWPPEDIWLKCRGCHGMDGKGNTTVGAKEKVPDFTSPDWQARITDDAIMNIITNGSQRNPKMKAWKVELTPKEIAGLVPYIRAFKEK